MFDKRVVGGAIQTCLHLNNTHTLGLLGGLVPPLACFWPTPLMQFGGFGPIPLEIFGGFEPIPLDVFRGFGPIPLEVFRGFGPTPHEAFGGFGLIPLRAFGGFGGFGFWVPLLRGILGFWPTPMAIWGLWANP